ncbi:MAG: hypothetical protein ACOYMG_29840 [Candidatus Methylumidiphilus sp.]
MKQLLDSLFTKTHLEPLSELVLKIAVPCPLRKIFDYLPPEGTDLSQLRQGMRVEIPFGQGGDICIGFLLAIGKSEMAEKSKIKPAYCLLDENPLFSEQDCTIIRWASRYYHHPLGELFVTAVPALLRKPIHERRLCLNEAGKAARPMTRSHRSPERSATTTAAHRTPSATLCRSPDPTALPASAPVWPKSTER